MKQLHGKSLANKINKDNIILVKPFLEARTKAMKHYVSPDLEKKKQTYLFYILASTALNLSVHLKRSPMK